MKPWKMGDFLSVKHGYPFQSEHFATEGHYVVVTPGNFYEAGGFKRIPGKEKYFTAQFPAEYLLKKGDLVVAMTQQTAGLLGSTAIIPADDEYLHNQRIGLISFDETVVDKLYLYYLFMTRSVRKQIEDSASGTKIKHTSPDKIYDVIVYLPNIDVQKCIGKLLWALEQKITNNACIATELESMAKTLYDYWFVQFDFPDANGKPYRASGGEMVWNEQMKREIPKGWSTKKIGDLLASIPNTVRIQTGEYKAAGKIPVIDQSTDFIAGYTDEDNSALYSEHGYIVFGDHTRIVKYIRFPFARGADGTQIVSSNDDRIPNELFYQSIKSIDLSNYGYARHFKFLKDTPVIVPTNEVAHNYIVIVKSMYDKIVQLLFENIELSKLRDWLLLILMNGQATVAPAESVPKLQVLQSENPARDPRFDRWLQTQGLAARGTVDEQTLHDIFDAMDDDDK